LRGEVNGREAARGLWRGARGVTEGVGPNSLTGASIENPFIPFWGNLKKVSGNREFKGGIPCNTTGKFGGGGCKICIAREGKNLKRNL